MVGTPRCVPCLAVTLEGNFRFQKSERGVVSFAYRSRRPFHPERFSQLTQRPFPGVFRAKGFFWLATRMDAVGGLNIAGAECYLSPAGQWWAAHAHNHEIPDRIKKDWVEPFGDRRQAIAFMGINLDPDELTTQLDRCLLDDAEMESDWHSLPDPFPNWSSPHHHHHDHGDGECCCHS